MAEKRNFSGFSESLPYQATTESREMVYKIQEKPTYDFLVSYLILD
jgi:hypothetical protein